MRSKLLSVVLASILSVTFIAPSHATTNGSANVTGLTLPMNVSIVDSNGIPYPPNFSIPLNNTWWAAPGATNLNLSILWTGSSPSDTKSFEFSTLDITVNNHSVLAPKLWNQHKFTLTSGTPTLLQLPVLGLPRTDGQNYLVTGSIVESLPTPNYNTSRLSNALAAVGIQLESVRADMRDLNSSYFYISYRAQQDKQIYIKSITFNDEFGSGTLSFGDTMQHQYLPQSTSQPTETLVGYSTNMRLDSALANDTFYFEAVILADAQPTLKFAKGVNIDPNAKLTFAPRTAQYSPELGSTSFVLVLNNKSRKRVEYKMSGFVSGSSKQTKPIYIDAAANESWSLNPFAVNEWAWSGRVKGDLQSGTKQLSFSAGTIAPVAPLTSSITVTGLPTGWKARVTRGSLVEKLNAKKKPVTEVWVRVYPQNATDALQVITSKVALANSATVATPVQMASLNDRVIDSNSEYRIKLGTLAGHVADTVPYITGSFTMTTKEARFFDNGINFPEEFNAFGIDFSNFTYDAGTNRTYFKKQICNYFKSKIGMRVTDVVIDEQAQPDFTIAPLASGKCATVNFGYASGDIRWRDSVTSTSPVLSVSANYSFVYPPS